MNVRARHRFGIIVALLGASSGTFAAGPTIAPQTVAAAGRARAIVTIDAPGRYAISAASKTGVAIELTTRMGGPEGEKGEAGKSDGRVDAFLDRGEYLVRTNGDDGAHGEAVLAVRPFRELHPGATDLIELVPVSATLADLEQATYRMTLSTRRPVAIEAAGRSLRDLRLWRDGSWLIDATPWIEVVDATAGRPLVVARIATTLEPGTYELVAYGGELTPWPRGGDANPLYLLWGIRSLPEASRQAWVVGPLGFDRFLVPASATLHRFELGEALPARMDIGTFDPSDPFRAGDQNAVITKDSVPPVAELELPRISPGARLVTIRTEPGTAYVLQSFDRRETYEFDRRGNYWISSISAGDPRDSLDATAILLRRPAKGGKWEPEPIAAATVAVAPSSPWRRRFNLIEPSSLLVRVTSGGSYELTLANDTPALVQIEPFFVYPPKGNKSPRPQAAPLRVDLETGLYRVSFTPIDQGIVDATLRAADDPAVDLSEPPPPPSASAHFGVIELDPLFHYRADLGTQAGVSQGFVLRQTPLDVATPLPLALAPGDTLSVPIRVRSGATIVAEREDRTRVELRLDAGPWSSEPIAATAGEHRVEVRAAADGRPTLATLRADLTPPVEPPPPREAKSVTPLAPGTPIYFDLAANAARTFTLTANRPGLYSVETSGLLATSGQLRTRLLPNLQSAAENGSGRNFRIRRYLEAGEYLVTVRAVGRSAGHLGIAARQYDVIDGGALSDGVAARTTVHGAGAVGFRFGIANPGRYRVRALVPGATSSGRLEDADGWPLVAPDATLDQTIRLDRGAYRLVAQPSGVDTRVVARLDALPEPEPRDGHGPFALTPGVSVDHVWLEPAEDNAARVSDTWLTQLPAAVTITLAVSREMKAVIERQSDEAWTTIAETSADGSWSGEIEGGAYRLQLSARRRDNRRSYTLALATSEMTAGDTLTMAREVTAPAVIPIAVGSAGSYELSSFGVDDVRATLLDADGKAIAYDDDRPDDWGFSIVRALTPGRYRLRIDPVGTSTAAVTLSLRALGQRAMPRMPLPFAGEVEPGDDVLSYPLALQPDDQVIAIDASANETVVLSLQHHTSGLVATASSRTPSIVLPLKSRDLTLHVSTPEHRQSRVQLRVVRVTPRAVSEAQLARGVKLEGGPSDLAVVALRFEGGATIALDQPPQGLMSSSMVGRPLEPATDLMSNSAAQPLWLGLRADATLRGRRQRLGDHEIALRIPGGVVATLDIAPASLPRLVRAVASVGVPGLSDRTVLTDYPASREGTASGEHAVLAAVFPQQAQAVKLWRADRDQAIDLKLDSQVFTVTSPDLWLQPGSYDGKALPASAVSHALPLGLKRATITLERGMAAVLLTHIEVEPGRWRDHRNLLWADAATLSETLVTDAQSLLVFAPPGGEGSYRIDLASASVPATVTATRPWIATLPNAGVARFTIVGAHHTNTLHLAGDGAELLGRLPPGSLEAETVRIAHNGGTVVAWLDDAWQNGWPEKLTPLTLPVSGELGLEPTRFALDGGDGRLLHLRGQGPAVAQLTRPGCGELANVYTGIVALDAVIRGPVTLGARALTRAGLLDVSSSALVTTGDGLAPTVVLAPGDARGFRFHVPRDGPIGIGVESDSGTVSVTVADLCGNAVASGVVLMPTLRPGDYVALLHAALDGPPTRARLALAGLNVPSDGPPQDIVRSYLEGDAPAASATPSNEIEESHE